MKDPRASANSARSLAAAGHAPARAADARLRVVRIIDRLNIGGPARHVAWLSAGLNADEFDCHLITGTVAPGETDMRYFASAAGVEPLVINEMSREVGLRDLIVLAKLVARFWKLKPDIIHTHKAKAGALGRIAAMIYRWLTPSAVWGQPRPCRVVHTYHGHIFHSYYGPLKTRAFIAIERLLARLATDRIIVLSEQQRAEISDRFRIGRPDQFLTVPLGLDLRELSGTRGRLRSELELGSDEICIGIVGRLCEVKNHVLLLEAARLLLESAPAGPRVRFAIIGDGHLRGELEERSRALGIAERVTFAGFRRDAASLYNDLDMVVLTSLNEGTPLTLIEALGCGRPVVSTEVGGVVDILGARGRTLDGFTVWDHGVTAPRNDAAAFARALRFLIDRPDLRRRMGARGRNFVRSNMSVERLINDLQVVYRDLAGSRAAVLPQPRARTVAQSN